MSVRFRLLAPKKMKHQVTAIAYDKRGRILSVGRNSYTKTHPLQSKYAAAVGKPDSIYLHAEVAALIKCDWTKVDTLFVSRYSKDGRPRNAKPCAICQSLINKVGIRNVNFTTDE